MFNKNEKLPSTEPQYRENTEEELRAYEEAKERAEAPIKRRQEAVRQLNYKHAMNGLEIRDKAEQPLGIGLYNLHKRKDKQVVFTEKPITCVPNGNHYCDNCCKNIGPHALELPSGAHVIAVDAFGVQVPKVLLGNPKIIKSADNVVTCPQCAGHFCGDECFTEAKNRFHDIICAPMGSEGSAQWEVITSAPQPKLSALTARIMAMLIQEEKNGIVNVTTELEDEHFPRKASNEDAISIFTRSLMSGGAVQEIETPTLPAGEKVPKYYSVVIGGSYDVLDTMDRASSYPELEKIIEREFRELKEILTIRGHGDSKLLDAEVYRDLRLIITQNSASLEIETTHMYEKSPGNFTSEMSTPVHGTSLSTIGSFVNHSCDPNLSVSNAYNYITEWVAERDIAEDEELTISYIDTSLPLEERRDILYNRYNFWCQCRLCTEQEAQEEMNEEE